MRECEALKSDIAVEYIRYIIFFYMKWVLFLNIS